MIKSMSFCYRFVHIHAVIEEFKKNGTQNCKYKRETEIDGASYLSLRFRYFRQYATERFYHFKKFDWNHKRKDELARLVNSTLAQERVNKLLAFLITICCARERRLRVARGYDWIRIESPLILTVNGKYTHIPSCCVNVTVLSTVDRVIFQHRIQENQHCRE